MVVLIPTFSRRSFLNLKVKKYEIWSTFAEVIAKIKVAHFFETRCRSNRIVLFYALLVVECVLVINMPYRVAYFEVASYRLLTSVLVFDFHYHHHHLLLLLLLVQSCFLSDTQDRVEFVC